MYRDFKTRHLQHDGEKGGGVGGDDFDVWVKFLRPKHESSTNGFAFDKRKFWIKQIMGVQMPTVITFQILKKLVDITLVYLGFT